MTITAFHPASLLSWYAARLPLGAVASAPKAGQLPPWDVKNPNPPKFTDVTARASKPYFDPLDKNIASGSVSAVGGAGSLIEALMEKRLSTTSGNSTLDKDNQKLFAMYQAISRLDHIANMANREDTIAGQLPGLNTSFQQGLSEVLSFAEGASLSGLTLMTGTKTAFTQSAAAVPLANYNYTGRGMVKQNDWSQAVSGVTPANQFTVAVTKAGTTTNVTMNMANVSGALTLDNINKYVNQQLKNAGFGTTFSRVQTGGSIADDSATWGIRINNSGTETVTLSSSQATASLYIAGVSGSTGGQQGKLLKLSDVAGTPDTVFSANITPDDGTSIAQATAVDSNGNAFVVGSTTGGFGNQINQASSDMFLTKYDSAGQMQWTRLLGSAESAAGYALTVDPTGGVVVAGSVTGTLTPTSVGGGSDSFVAKYDNQGNRKWLRHTAPVANDQANTLLVDSTGNVYVGGQLSGAISSSHTSAGGVDAYVTKLSSNGALLYHRQFGTSGNDSVAQMAFDTNGRLIVAGVEDGDLVLRKYDVADGTSAAKWTYNIGDLQGGTIGGLVKSDNEIYISGTTTNADLTPLSTSIANAHSGGTDAFVFNITDRPQGSGSLAPRPQHVTYVGTAVSEQGGGLALSGGKLYLTGTTTGTFSGQTRSVQGTHNMYVQEVNTDGTLGWVRQYGGLEAQSKGISIAADDTGASVLDKLGLGRGKIEMNQSSALESQTTVRAGDYFTMRITDHSGTRDAKITAGTGDTLRSLVAKMNGHLLQAGKASVVSSSAGQKLKIEVNPGVEIELIAGPKDFDALAGLGMDQRFLINDKQTAASAKSTVSDLGSVFGLGIAGKLDLLTKANASHAHSALQAALSVIKQAYTQLNPSASSATTSFGAGSAYIQSRLANYQLALSWWG